MKSNSENAKNTTEDPNINDIGALTQERATPSNALETPSIELPKGGGALQGIDEKFKVNSSNGTSSLGITVPVSPGRNGFSPVLNINYNSGAGNGIFGLGWSLELPAIVRKTDKGIPKYDSSDIFMFSGAEDLIPYLKENGPGNWEKESTTQGDYTISRYRPRITSDHSRIEKIDHPTIGTYWRITDASNVTTFYGRTLASRITDPNTIQNSYKWLPEFSYDNQGNWIAYEYKAENFDQVTNTIQEAHRLSGNQKITNTYLKRIKYFNTTAYYPSPQNAYDPPAPDDETFHLEVVLDYGEHDTLNPSPNEVPDQLWNLREDAFSSFKSGFEIRTFRRCERVLMFHHFPEEQQHDGTPFGTDYLVKSLEFEYTPSNINNAGLTEVLYLSSLISSGYVRKPDNSYSKKSLPPITLEYQQLQWNTEIKTINHQAIENTPIGLSQNYRWIDLFGEGISGILSEQAEGWYYKHNLGALNEAKNLVFETTKKIAPKPSFQGLGAGTLTLTDLDADGKKQLVTNTGGVQGYFEVNQNETWNNFQPFEAIPNVDLGNAYVKIFDITGDGKADIVLTEERVITYYESQGRKGYKAQQSALKALDEEQGPAIVFEDQEGTIFLGDMTGDGLTDIVRIRNGEVCYWANMGYGTYSAKVTMANAPRFDLPDQFHPKHIHLTDISGTGTTDIIYKGKNTFKAFLNLSGNGFSEPHDIDPFFPIDNLVDLKTVDLLGNGTSCLVWSSNMPGDRTHALRYIDLMAGKKPHLMIGYANNMGASTTLEYKSSTYFYLKDKLAGVPWVTQLPFPVQVVAKSTIEEQITNVKFSSQYLYHHGYYDHDEREFRGFGRVEKIDSEHYTAWHDANQNNELEQSESLFQQPVLTKTWFHTGAFMSKNNMLDHFKQEYWYHHFETLFPGVLGPISEPQLEDAIFKPSTAIQELNIMDTLNAQEYREASRACKGMVLRTEVYALDATENAPSEAELQLQNTPYSVATHNCHIMLQQPLSENRYACFQVLESEAYTIQYERNTSDPRITHTLNLEVDRYGNVLEAASVSYPRITSDPTLPAKVIAEQEKTRILYTRNGYTNDVISTTNHRLRMGYETEMYELTAIPKIGTHYTLDDFNDVLNTATQEITYQTQPTIGIAQRRKIEHNKKLYYNNDLTNPLAPQVLESQGFVYESYALAFTPSLLHDIYGTKIAANFPETAAFYVHFDGDSNWWVPSGTMAFLTAGETAIDAQNRFYVPITYTDPSGTKIQVSYYKNYFNFISSILDALGNQNGIERHNFRTLSPSKTRDANDNLSEVIFDELGLLKASAALGKDLDVDGIAELELADDLSNINEWTDHESVLLQNYFQETDPVIIDQTARTFLQQASTRFLYDMEAYRTLGKPIAVSTIQREQHHAHLNLTSESPLRITFEYTSGLGSIVMTKAKTEPGIAKQTTVLPNLQYAVSEINTAALPEPQIRWIGNGRTVFNNKGNPVKQYEPFFSITPLYEDAPELVASGVTSIAYYDSLSRLYKTEFPEGTLSMIVFDAWKKEHFDQNDMVLQSDWYHNRINNLIDAELLAAGKDPSKEKTAAEKAAMHAQTPSIGHFDPLGRPIMTIAHNKRLDASDEFIPTAITLDIEGNTQSVTDARGHDVMEYTHDMLGHRIQSTGIDSGSRWIFFDALGQPIRNWDDRDHCIETSYDALRRIVEKRVVGGDGAIPLNHIFEKIHYGEGATNDKLLNLRRKPQHHYDTAGKIEFLSYDFKGNLRHQSRSFAQDYKAIVDWSIANPDAALQVLPGKDTQMRHDALNRVVEKTNPDSSITANTYKASGLLEQVRITQNGNAALFIKDIDYNEKGQRKSIIYGNDVKTSYAYDTETYKLLSITSRKLTNEILQELHYTYDAVGNITETEDKAIPTVFFANHSIQPRNKYTYDAVYRLIEAEGKEHIGQTNHHQCDTWNDLPFIKNYSPGSDLEWRNYTQRYSYDLVHNITQMRHTALQGNWTRNYEYEAANNRLIRTSIGTQVYNYTYHPAHGFMTSVPHLGAMEWNFKGQLHSTNTQNICSGALPETTYYVYDGKGKRVRKITENQSINGNSPTIKEERHYLGDLESYFKITGTNAGLERTTLHIKDDHGRLAMIDTRNAIDDGTDIRTIRYQLTNRSHSATIELDHNAQVISYEEFHPYGTTAYLAVNASIKAAAKRYKYSGMERDSESGLSYHNSRYYIPWLGRWLKTDPQGIKDGVNLYCYVSGNPIRLIDPNGTSAWDSFMGGVKMVGGALETAAGVALVGVGAATSEIGVGIPIMAAGAFVTAHGADVTVSGARTMIAGEQVDTGSSMLMQEAGMSRTSANLVDAGISVVGTLGAGAATKAPAAAVEGINLAQPSVSISHAAGAPSAAGITNPLGYAVGHSRIGITLGDETATVWSHLTVPGERVMMSGGALVAEGDAVITTGTALAPKFASVATIEVSAAEAQAAMGVVRSAAPAATTTEGVTQGGYGAYAFLANDCASYCTTVLAATEVTASGASPATLFMSAAVRTETPVRTLMTSAAVMQPASTTGAIVNTATGIGSLTYDDTGDEPVSSEEVSKVETSSLDYGYSENTSYYEEAPVCMPEDGYYDNEAQVCYSE